MVFLEMLENKKKKYEYKKICKKMKKHGSQINPITGNAKVVSKVGDLEYSSIEGYDVHLKLDGITILKIVSAGGHKYFQTIDYDKIKEAKTALKNGLIKIKKNNKIK